MLHMSPMKGAATRSSSDPLAGSVEALTDENVDLKRKVDLLMRKLSDQKLQTKVDSTLSTPPSHPTTPDRNPGGGALLNGQWPSSTQPRTLTDDSPVVYASPSLATAPHGPRWEKVLPTLVTKRFALFTQLLEGAKDSTKVLKCGYMYKFRPFSGGFFSPSWALRFFRYAPVHPVHPEASHASFVRGRYDNAV